MRLSSFCFSLLAPLAVLHTASAVITGISLGKQTLVAGHKFNVTFHTADALTNNQQNYVLFGLSERAVFNETIGSAPFAHRDITAYKKGGKPFHVVLTAPSDIKHGATYNLSAVVFGSVGQSGSITAQFFTEKTHSR